MERKLYAAYGSNLNIAQMQRRCPKAEFSGTAQIKDYRLVFRGSKTGSYLSIERAEGHCVPIGLWLVTPEDERALDIYEGFPQFYRKEQIQLDDGRTGFCYVMNENRPYGIPSPFYMAVCQEGYKDMDFDPSFLKEAFEYSFAEAEK